MKLITPSFLQKMISGKRVLVDTNIIIYLTDMVQPYASLSRQLFEMVEEGAASAVFSIISIAEVMQGPLRKGSNQNAKDIRNYLVNFPNSFSQEINSDVLGHIGDNRQIDWSKLRAVDSLIIASGLAMDVDLFVSNDRHFKRAIPNDFILTLDI